MKHFLAVLAALVLASCSKPGFNNVDITGASYASEFSLTDHTGARRTSVISCIVVGHTSGHCV